MSINMAGRGNSTDLRVTYVWESNRQLNKRNFIFRAYETGTRWIFCFFKTEWLRFLFGLSLQNLHLIGQGLESWEKKCTCHTSWNPDSWCWREFEGSLTLGNMYLFFCCFSLGCFFSFFFLKMFKSFNCYFLGFLNHAPLQTKYFGGFQLKYVLPWTYQLYSWQIHSFHTKGKLGWKNFQVPFELIHKRLSKK